MGESSCELEHRDLHLSNILVQPTSEDHLPFHLHGEEEEPSLVASEGLRVTIIDFSLSRTLSKEGDVVFKDLSEDEELFKAEGDIQFDVYR